MRSLFTARPVLVAAAVGGVLAWPVADRWDPWAALLVGLLVGLGGAVDFGVSSRWARGLTLVGFVGLAAMSVVQRPLEPVAGLVVAIGGTLAVAWSWGWLRDGSGGVEEAPVVSVVALTLAALLVPQALFVPRVWLVSAVAVLGLLALSQPDARSGWRPTDAIDQLLTSPARLLVVSFAAISVGGAALLVLPPAYHGLGSIRPIDALFTSVSATCVTGLAVLDTEKDFTRFGQAVILLLIQVGGLGIMTFATAAAVFLGRRMSLREEAVAAELMGGGARRDLEAALRTVLRVTFASEAIGALLLAGLFLAHGDTPGMALWRGVFTSISAFCNAGFAIQSAGLVPYQSSPGVLAVVGALIVIGGLGPMVVAAAPALWRGGGGVHARLVVRMSAWFVLAPAALFLVLEWHGVLGGMSLIDRLANAMFQSITLRTAGFNSIDFSAIQPATWTLCLVCMFVGGSPASTAGGAKTTTVAVLLLAVRATILGRGEAAAYHRRIPHRTVYDAAAIVMVGLLSTLAALVALQVTQDLSVEWALFEVVSALGTVGLTMGATAKLDDVGKLVIMACMFAGRVGPLTLFIFLVGRSRPGRKFPLEAVQVG